MLILDLGSGNGKGNDNGYVQKVIDTIEKEVGDEGKSQIVLKYQLFEKELDSNIPLKRETFQHAFAYAQSKKIMVTASVFDVNSLYFLLQFPVPFVKLACDKVPTSELIGATPRGIKILYSVSKVSGLMALPQLMTWGLDQGMCCIPDYPAKLESYEKEFPEMILRQSVSDHTIGSELWEKYKPFVFEKHCVLERDKANPDSGPFAILTSEIKNYLPKKPKANLWEK